MIFWRTIFGTVAALSMTTGVAGAQQPAAAPSMTRQSLDDAWWTGPLLAPSAATLARGHALIEPYFYDVRSSDEDSYGSLSYWLYGVTNRFTAGLIPTFGYKQVRNGLSSSGIGLGDLTLLEQYGLTQFHEGRWRPTTAINFQETLPTGKYDRLGNRVSDGLGGGTYTTSVGFYSQTYFWLANGRILRMRFNVLQAFSKRVEISDSSVYGTVAGFRGHATPGSSLFVDLAGEYSVTKQWVIALDIAYRHGGSTRVTGYNVLEGNRAQDSDSGSSDAVIFAPAIEYNFTPRVGVIFGTRIIEIGHNANPSITPVAAINIVH